jgi:hypothetical protein
MPSKPMASSICIRREEIRTRIMTASYFTWDHAARQSAAGA